MGADVQTIVVLVGCFTIVTLACAVLILVEERRVDPMRQLDYRRPEPLTLLSTAVDAEQAPEVAEVGCRACHGTGVVDVTDDWDRPIIYDASCRVCRGTGLVEVGA